MPKLPKLPRDFSQAAKLVVDIASGQVEDREPTPEEQGKGHRQLNGRSGAVKWIWESSSVMRRAVRR